MQQKAKALTLQEIAEATKSRLIGDPAIKICGVATIVSASTEEVSFVASAKYEMGIPSSKAAAFFVITDVGLPDMRNYLVHPNPTEAIQQVVEMMFPEQRRTSGFSGIHPTAVVHETSTVDPTATIGPYVVVDAHVTIGKNAFVGSHSYIGPFSTIAEDCIVDPHVTLRQHCHIQARTVVQSGSVLGACGYGYATDKQGKHTHVKHVGEVVVEEDVDVGANSTIDRARFSATRIGKGSKIDNLVYIGHNVQIGSDNMVIGQTGVAGSTTTGKRVILAGQVAVSGHLNLADGVIVGGKSGVSKSLNKPGVYRGIPAQPIDEWNRNTVMMRNIKKHVGELKALKQKPSFKELLIRLFRPI